MLGGNIKHNYLNKQSLRPFFNTSDINKTDDYNYK